MIELVIFDCDGTLIDSETLGIEVDRVAMAAFGLPMSEREIIDRFVGLDAAAKTAALSELLGRPLPADWWEEYRPLHNRLVEEKLAPMPGVPEALAAIDLPTCVASNSSHSWLRRGLELTGLYERFAGRIFSGAEDVPRGKPAPDLFLHAARTLGADPAACVVVEDSAHGVAAARAAGMPVLAYTAGVTPPERLAGPGTVLFDDMRELPRLLAAGP
ncbi:HAD superfamily hydrolase (TIGR01509 family) [Kitasatospora viridis]|uniref:HAD superfamily hydrolase (TIGR01509 family) n=1 Tax=Kitasatospora viridis TaxID=281105 RepID=A0A561UB01_9ACTN|nr:HAD superfamily hydrolase (TIGR01509 family) [Kitasatospora viridis]